ncbi:MAG TPA: DUF4383 domain-containing protein [Acidimicrobiales bacterium]|nr:DUF4383 domain-containing protein [Acidimicrobiales bacterium]
MTYEYRGNTLGKSGGPQRGGSKKRAPSAPEPRPVPQEKEPRSGGRSVGQLLAAIFGLTFLLAGVGGFIPGVTQDYDGLSLYGTDSTAELLGLFRISVVHNIVHLLFGVGLLAAARASWSKVYLLGGAVAYGAVLAYGLVVDQESDANLLPINDEDNLLHIGLTAGLLVAGLVAVAVDRRGSRS